MKNFAKFLPSRRFSAILGSLLFVAVLIWGTGQLRESNLTKSNFQNQPAVIVANNNEQALLEKVNSTDSDNDGLKDWEEALWKTDPNNRDTDQDGKSDGDEVKSGRDPKKKGPNDQLETGQEANRAQVLLTPDTQTDRLAKTFFSLFLQAKSENKNLSDQEAIKMATKSIQLNTVGTSLAKVYAANDFKVTTDNSLDQLKKYGNSMGSLVLENKDIMKDEIEILEKALASENKNALGELSTISLAYKNVIQGTLNIPVPEKALQNHIRLVNALQKLQSSAEEMALVFDDPSVSLSGLQKQKEGSHDLLYTLQDVNLFFGRNLVNFKTADPGFVFAKAIQTP